MRQKRLFDDEPMPWELDDRSDAPVASVVFAGGGPSGRFDYSIPPELLERVTPGCRVVVPLGRGNRSVTGYCVEVQTRPMDRRLKPVTSVVDERRLLSDSMIRLTQWIAEHYLCDWGQVLETVIPAGVRGQAGTRMASLLSLSPDLKERLKEIKLTPKQLHVLKVLKNCQPVTSAELAKHAKVTASPINTLKNKGLITVRTVRQQSSEFELSPDVARGVPHQLNPDQQQALDAIVHNIRSETFRTMLLHGVTGSGKTEVYIRAIDEAVRRGRQAIVLVPEISLTPQTVGRFRERFDHVAVLHSHLTDADRHRQWQWIASGEVQVVVGARSAIFAPTHRLGLVVLDEEHESSFKQGTAPRYHARDVAIWRAREEGVPLVLGSATPSLESWHHAVEGEYQLVSMPRRVRNLAMPAVDTIDLSMRNASSRGGYGAVHRQLHIAMQQALRDGGQVILLLNRRGFSTHIQCPGCGHVLVCPECEIALTHHQTEQIALCHYCDHQVPAPNSCSECGFDGIRYSGFGTQKLEAEVRRRFPNVPTLRMDTDTMQGRGSHERALARFRSGEVRILLGTQMIAKGLDFPDVTLVGVINADTALHLPDFRASERTFHLVTQVAGRTGRGDRGGRVLIQTFNPDHAALQSAVRHDFVGFAKQELPMRKLLKYPPFSRMARLVVRGPIEDVAEGFATDLAKRIEQSLKDLEADARLLGPAPAPFAKLRGMYRYQIQVQSSDGDLLRRAVRHATLDLKPPDDVQWIVDIDPIDML